MTTYNGWKNRATWVINMWLGGNYSDYPIIEREVNRLLDRFFALPKESRGDVREYMMPFLRTHARSLNGYSLQLYITAEARSRQDVYRQYWGGIAYDPNTQIVHDPVRKFADWLREFTTRRMTNTVPACLPDLTHDGENDALVMLNEVDWLEIAYYLLEES